MTSTHSEDRVLTCFTRTAGAIADVWKIVNKEFGDFKGELQNLLVAGIRRRVYALLFFETLMNALDGKSLNVAVIGLGAVGGSIAGRLAKAGHRVSALVRDANVKRLRENGLQITEPSLSCDGGFASYSVRIKVVSDVNLLGPQDVVIVAVKSTGLASVVESVATLAGPDSTVLTAMNGIPWWFFAKEGHPYSSFVLESVDPGGTIARKLPANRVVGGVVMWSASCASPGVVRIGSGNRFTIGEALGGSSTRLSILQSALLEAGFDVNVSRDIRVDVWYKLWGNMTANPVSAMTGATYDQILQDPLVMRFIYECMSEATEIGEKIGCPIQDSGERLMVEAGKRLGAFKTSMLQDVEARRPVEIDALIASVREIGHLVGVATPRIDALLGLCRLHAKTHGLYPD
jgi:2-dehydropantoate 2-reductase